MQTLQDMQNTLKSVDDLHSVVRTMKSLAAVSIQQYEEAAESLEEYFEAVELGLRAALRDRPLIGRREALKNTVILLFGSDQGMAGRFNEAVLELLTEDLAGKRVPGERFSYWVVGSKALGAVEAEFGEAGRFYSLPPSATGITGAVQQVLLDFDQSRQEKGEQRLILYHNIPAGGASYDQIRVDLLPPDRAWLETLGGRSWPARQIPYFSLPWQELFGALIAEYLFVALSRAFAASMAAENAARLAAMQRAEKNIEETREELTRQYHTMRQNSISEELFDVISGFEALTGESEEANSQ